MSTVNRTSSSITSYNAAKNMQTKRGLFTRTGYMKNSTVTILFGIMCLVTAVLLCGSSLVVFAVVSDKDSSDDAPIEVCNGTNNGIAAPVEGMAGASTTPTHGTTAETGNHGTTAETGNHETTAETGNTCDHVHYPSDYEYDTGEQEHTTAEHEHNTAEHEQTTGKHEHTTAGHEHNTAGHEQHTTGEHEYHTEASRTITQTPTAAMTPMEIHHTTSVASNSTETMTKQTTSWIPNMPTQMPTTSNASLQESCCLDEWVEFYGSCYFYERIAVTWTDAEAFCVSLGSHLIHVNNEMEFEFTRRVARDRKGFCNWIGLSDGETEGTWRWTDTSMPGDGNYSQFREGEPNGGTRENCVTMMGSLNHEWVDVSCTTKCRPICETSNIIANTI